LEEGDKLETIFRWMIDRFGHSRGFGKNLNGRYQACVQNKGIGRRSLRQRWTAEKALVTRGFVLVGGLFMVMLGMALVFETWDLIRVWK
jgi:hypothetical protein